MNVITRVLQFSWCCTFITCFLISCNLTATLRSVWNLIFIQSISAISVGCTAGFIPDLPRLQHTKQHFPFPQQIHSHRHTHSLLTASNLTSAWGCADTFPITTTPPNDSVQSTLTLKVMMRWVKWNSASRFSWTVTFSTPDRKTWIKDMVHDMKHDFLYANAEILFIPYSLSLTSRHYFN